MTILVAEFGTSDIIEAVKDYYANGCKVFQSYNELLGDPLAGA